MRATWATRVAAVVLVVFLVPAAGAKAADTSGDAVVAVFSLDRPVTESPSEEFPFGTVRSESLKDLVARMKKARDDKNVKAVVLLSGSGSLGLGQAEEIRRVMEEIQAAKKPVLAHADTLSTGRYVLLSGASEISMSPTGYLFLTGLYGEGLYVRGLLDKIGVVPDYLTCGAYKSAAEMFMRKAPSSEAEQMQEWIFDSLYETFLDLIAKGRDTSTKKVKQWIDGGLYSAERAKKLGIIDSVQHRHDFVADLKSRYGEEVKLDTKYGKRKTSKIDLSSPMGLLQLWAKLLGVPDIKKTAKNTVAVIYVDGPILPGKPEPSPFGGMRAAYSTPIRKALDKAAQDDSVKAVVLRVDSPGGSAVASEIILDATKRVSEKKPFVVSMGDVAGSGGYYVACGAETIFADALTITGSIGVVGGKFATTEMWNKIGITWKSYARGKSAGLLSSQDVFTDQERKKLQSWMDEIYGVFKGHVVEVRGDRLKKGIDALAGGRVYTGAQALELGLVDKIGGLDDALAHVAKEAGLDDYVVRVLPRPKNPMELLFGDLSDGDDDGTISLSAGFTSPGTRWSLWARVLPLLSDVDPRRLEAVKLAIFRLDMLQKDGAVLMMPEILVGQ